MSSNNKGFTLIELIAVLFILSLVLLIVSPTIKKTIEYNRLKNDAYQLAAILRLMRQEAITTQSNKTILFYPSIQSYRVVGRSTYYLSDDIFYLGSPTFPNITNTPGCRFNASGSPSSGGTITLQNKNNDKIYIILNPVAGRVRVSDTPPAHW